MTFAARWAIGKKKKKIKDSLGLRATNLRLAWSESIKRKVCKLKESEPNMVNDRKVREERGNLKQTANLNEDLKKVCYGERTQRSGKFSRGSKLKEYGKG